MRAERAALTFDDDRFPHNNRKASARLNYVILDPDNTLMHSSRQFIERLNASTHHFSTLTPIDEGPPSSMSTNISGFIVFFLCAMGWFQCGFGWF
jgi:hypothetical protein